MVISMKYTEKIKELSSLIGNTPLLEIHYSYKGVEDVIYAKAEHYNLTGSIKDRPALYMMAEAYRTGAIKEGQYLTEATSGNAGIAFCAIGAQLGNPAIIYMPDWMSKERVHLMESFGAEVRLVSKEEGGFLGSIEKTKILNKEIGAFLPCQFANEDNPTAHYLGTGSEIASQLEKLGLKADGLVAGVGTGGTVVGTGRKLKEINPNALIMPLEPKSSPTLTTGYKVGSHRIAGISDEFIPDIVKNAPWMDRIIQVDDGDAINMARMLSKTQGLGVGISSGANMLGAIIAKNQLGRDTVITTVFSDDNKKYLTTDYAKEQPYEEDHLTKDIKIVGVRVHR